MADPGGPRWRGPEDLAERDTEQRDLDVDGEYADPDDLFDEEMDDEDTLEDDGYE
jgi:hypothetical protein